MSDQGCPISQQTLARFADEASAQKYLEGLLWPNGPVCHRCGGNDRVGKLDGASTRLGTYKCYACRRAFSVTCGTIFSASHVPLHKWLQAIYLTDGGTIPIRPHHLQRILNVSFKTASSILRKLRDAASNADTLVLSAMNGDTYRSTIKNEGRRHSVPTTNPSASWPLRPQTGREAHASHVATEPYQDA
ncbi:MAG: transposase [Alphaproteobacteria bacterium]|nr:transposase [Alphaproteobacteria bacterium]MBV8406075.1 transposase [Alphaproteobacteria bacterium]